MPRNDSSLCNAVATLLLLALCACGTGGSGALSRAAAKPAPAVAGLALPAPSSLIAGLPPTRTASYTEADLEQEGDDRDFGLPLNRVGMVPGDPAGHAVLLSPQYQDFSTLADAAYCCYHFLLDEYDRNPQVRLGLPDPAPPTQNLFIGLSDWDADRWAWFGCDSQGWVSLPEIDPYIDASGDMLVCVAAIGTTAIKLESVRIGTETPLAAISATPHVQRVPFMVQFNAIGSSDSDGSIEHYEWDFDGDGAYDADSGALSATAHEYTVAGSYLARVRVTDNDGASATAEVEVLAYEPWSHTWGGTAVDELSAYALDSAGYIYAAGQTLSSMVSEGNYDALLLKYDFRGELLWAKTYGTANTERLRDIVLGPDGMLYAVGEYYSDGVHPKLLLCQFDSEGVLKWAKQWGGAGDDRGSALFIWGTELFVTGDTAAGAISDSDLLLLNCDTAGTLNWAYSWGTSGDDFGRDIVPESPLIGPISGCAIAGTSQGIGLGDVVYLNFNTAGELLEQRSWGSGARTDECVALARTLGGQTWLLGQSMFPTGEDCVLLGFDSNGDPSLRRRFGTSSADLPAAISIVAGGDLLIGGSYDAIGGDRAFVLRSDPGFTAPQLLAATFSGNGGVARLGMLQDAGMLVAGSASNSFASWASAALSYDQALADPWTPQVIATEEPGYSFSNANLGTRTVTTSVPRDSGGGGADCWLSFRDLPGD